jgi:hypothetical protein
MYNIDEMSVATKGYASPWLLLVFSLARKRGSLRVTVWRKLQRFGALPFGNSGYLLPNSLENRERFEWLATMIRSERGEASVVEVQSIDNHTAPRLKRLFTQARTSDYQDLLRDIRKVAITSSKTGRAARLRNRFQEIASIDFFGSSLRDQVERALAAVEKPKTEESRFELEKVSRASYRRRVWVTRPRPGVDRVTSAWLIRKFIDPKARFVFASEAEKPADAIPYDMYEDGFGHRGEDCTFETLLRAFGIRDKRAGVMGQIVHDADLFDEKFGRKEGFGLDEIMKGWAQQGLRDQELLARGMQLAEGLYQSLG